MKKYLLAGLFLTYSITTNAFNSGNLSGNPIGDTHTQQVCTQYGSTAIPLPANANSVWAHQGLNRSIDNKVYKLDIVAYKIRWSSGWSDWIVKGVNDLYSYTTVNLTTPYAVDARLAWIYFYDHPHLYIGCSTNVI